MGHLLKINDITIRSLFILERLSSEETMEYQLGHHPGQMLRFIPRTINYRYTKIIDRLEESGFITCRKPRPDERGSKYCYRTESGKQFLDQLNRIHQ